MINGIVWSDIQDQRSVYAKKKGKTFQVESFREQFHPIL
jgi:hypothetical protein